MHAAIKWHHARKVLFALLIAITVWWVGMSQLKDWQGPAGSLTNDLFIPAIMMNAGHGFVNIAPATIPELRSFLDFQTSTFDTALIPGDVEIVPLHPYQEFHRYLIYSVAAAWKIKGISWDTIKVLILIYFFFACLAVYGICRLAMNPLFSLLVVISFIYAPSVSQTLPILRDFAKAPFILAVMLLSGTIAFKILSRRYFLLYSLLTGVILGIGMGIRRDMIVFLPISILVLLLGSIKSKRYDLLTRFLAVTLLIISFVLAGWPVHKSFMREGLLASHDTIMGFSSFSDRELGLLGPASYEKHYLLNDMYSTIRSHYAAGAGITFPKSIYQKRAADPTFDFEVKQAYVQKIIMTFPADMLARSYAAVLSIIVGITQTPFGIEKYGLWFVSIALVLIASRNPFRAWLLLALLCYFCGYTSIQFTLRHAFHTSFVPFFFLGFLLHHMCYYLGEKAGFKYFAIKTSNKKEKLNWIICRRTTIWLLLTIIIFYTPLLAAQHLQHKKIEELRRSYETADITPVNYKILQWDGKPFVAPTESIRIKSFEGKCLLEDFEMGILVAAFDNINMTMELHAIYEGQGGIGDFGGPLTVSVLKNEQTCPGKLYFPIYEKTTYRTDWTRFAGLSMSEEAISSFQGLYRVKDRNHVGLLANILLPDDKKEFCYNQYLSIPWNGKVQYPYAFNKNFFPVVQRMKIQHYLKEENFSKALELAAKMLKQRPGSIIFTLLLAEAQERSGAMEESYKTCANLLMLFPNIPASYEQLDLYFDKQGGVQRRVAGWSSILTHTPTLIPVKEHLEAATLDIITENNATIKK
ncbi:MAG: hypothetical protein KAH38_00750 [Candidatus Hydrogenedentes bacterium]|nr:hypothetical protein [Candidatus Hydrogenedentota bacterium]